MALFNTKLDEHADPKVQIRQAMEESRRQHATLTDQAARVLGNQRKLEMDLSTATAAVEKLNGNVRQSLALADAAAADGDTDKVTEFTNAAEAFAAELITIEANVESLKALHSQAVNAAAQAAQAVDQSAVRIQEQAAGQAERGATVPLPNVTSLSDEVGYCPCRSPHSLPYPRWTLSAAVSGRPQ